MSTFRSALLMAIACLAVSTRCEAQSSPDLGRPLAPDEVKDVDITVFPDGRGLPPGSGSVSAGAKVYEMKCQACHGEEGRGGPQDRLTGGIGTLLSMMPTRRRLIADS